MPLADAPLADGPLGGIKTPRLCVVPVTGTGTKADPRRPKYFGSSIKGEAWGATDYGFEPWMLVFSDFDDTHVPFLQMQADSTLVPEDLDRTLSAAQVTSLADQLELMPIPGDWITTAHTWREVCRRAIGTCRFMARYAVVFYQATGTTTPLFSGGVTLATTYGELSAAAKTALFDTADQLGVDRSSVVDGTTLRTFLTSIGSQLGAGAVTLGQGTI